MVFTSMRSRDPVSKNKRACIHKTTMEIWWQRSTHLNVLSVPQEVQFSYCWMDRLLGMRAELKHEGYGEKNTTHMFIKIPTEQAEKHSWSVCLHMNKLTERAGVFEAACRDVGRREGPTRGGGRRGGESGPAAHLFLGAWVVRGGVTGRPELTPPYWYFAFFSEGFRIWKEHMRDSSTLIMPPALSNSPQ